MCNFVRFFSVVLLGIAIAGCSSGPVEEKIVVPTSNIVASVKKTLEDYAKSGQVGSSLTSLESDINAIKSSDAAKGAALYEGYQKLQAATSQENVKEIAKQMLSKL